MSTATDWAWERSLAQRHNSHCPPGSGAPASGTPLGASGSSESGPSGSAPSESGPSGSAPSESGPSGCNTARAARQIRPGQRWPPSSTATRVSGSWKLRIRAAPAPR